MIPSPGTGSRLRAVRSKREPYAPVLSAVERAAYAAAHRIMTQQTVAAELACAGSRRSAQVDAIAAIIVREMEGINELAGN